MVYTEYLLESCRSPGYIIHRHFFFLNGCFLLYPFCVDFILLQSIKVVPYHRLHLFDSGNPLGTHTNTRALVQGYHVGLIVQYLFSSMHDKSKKKRRKKKKAKSPQSLVLCAIYALPQLCMKIRQKQKKKMLTSSITTKECTLKD